MAYFNHAFRKTFLSNSKNPSATLDEGFVTASGVRSVDLLGTYGVGVTAFIDPSTYLTVNNASATVTGGKPLILVATSVFQNDKIGPFIGGYQETTKSKLINPKYVNKFYRVDPCLPNPNVIHVGDTPYTDSLSPAPAGCCHDFVCNQTYYLRVDVKGSPVLRFLTRNAYWTADAYTGCCPGSSCSMPAPCTIVDPTIVFIGWATGLLGQGTVGGDNFIPNKIVGPFIAITVYDYAGTAWYQPGTNGGVQEWDTYLASAQHAAFNPAIHTCANDYAAGMKIQGAYVDTKFGDCTFYPSDFFEKEPVHIYASEVDQLGDPCVFTGICVAEQCCPRQGMGFGEQVLRDFILDQSYMQNYFNTNLDLRIREVTQGYDISSAIDRNAFYYRYYILHSVPRFNNPTGVFDNDQYLLEIITNGVSASLETQMATWLTACSCGASLETNTCEISACPCTSPIVLSTTTAASHAGSSTPNFHFYTSGGSGGNFQVVVSAGSLPPGLTLTEATGVTAGTLTNPTVATAYTFTITASDNDGCSTSTTYTWIITHV